MQALLSKKHTSAETRMEEVKKNLTHGGRQLTKALHLRSRKGTESQPPRGFTESDFTAAQDYTESDTQRGAFLL
uniref:Uncharacterized protein n=1 Tax=Arundo donax TaxID=35708 RepID=A0A0A9GW17_ARUDO